jgi:hypothetical protein
MIPRFFKDSALSVLDVDLDGRVHGRGESITITAFELSILVVVVEGVTMVFSRGPFVVIVASSIFKQVNGGITSSSSSSSGRGD